MLTFISGVLGVLDSLANRCFADGTNAWTDVDHTCYTVGTAGEEGFLNLLPIYMDHILYPTLTDDAFHTEVHHITHEGCDAGVVYCEMEARENTGESLTHRTMMENLFKGSGYTSETGGLLENLRSLTNKKVRDYHKAVYRPDNITIVIAGKMDFGNFERSMSKMEVKIESKGALPSMERPWSTPVPKLEESVFKELSFAADDESIGLVSIGWQGPGPNDFLEVEAIQLLGEYLAGSPVGPLQKELVELEEPLCGDIRLEFLEQTTCGLMIAASNVTVELIKEVLLVVGNALPLF